MLNSDISICNYALSLIGQRSIRSFDEDNSRARLCKNTYTTAVEVVLSRLDWAFARWVAELRQDPSVTTEDGYGAYALPADFMTVLDLHPFDTNVPYEQRGGYLITPITEVVKLKYTRRISDVSKFATAFKHAVAKLVMAQLAGPLAGASLKEVMSLSEAFEYEIMNVSVIDASVGSKEAKYDNDPDTDTFNKV